MKGHIDVESLRIVEGELDALRHFLNIGLHAVVEGWAFLLLIFEFDGDGTAWTGTTSEAENFPAVARRQAERLRQTSQPTIELRPVESYQSLPIDQVIALAEKVQAMGALVDALTPKGWGYAVLVFQKHGPGQAYAANAERADMIEALEEFATNLEAGLGRPPGVLGREN